MRSHIRNRARAQSLTTVAPSPESEDYSPNLAKAAASILYQSPIRSKAGHPIYILNAAALPDVKEVEYNALLPYVIARLPGEEELVSGAEYEVIFFAGAGVDGTAAAKKSRPGWGWLIQAYHLLSRAMRKRIQKLYIVHEKTWVRMITAMFSSVVSPKFRRKIVHAGTLTQLGLYLPIEDLLIPPSAYLQDRGISPDIYVPYATGKRAFAARNPLPVNFEGTRRLPRVLRETTSFILMPSVVITEGLFRIPPHAKLKEVLREAYDRGQKFIVWKSHDSMLPQPHYAEVIPQNNVIQELDSVEAYGPHLAAGLTKLWYTELREQIVPQTSYKELMRLHGSAETAPTLEQMLDLVSPASEWSLLSASSRELLVRHLLPMLHEVASHEEYNKMSPENLAVCFAPTFVCGTDQMEDIKISSVVRRVLTALIANWPDIRTKCGLNAGNFWDDLKAPPNMDDYEDPLDETQPSQQKTEASPVEIHSQQSGIILEDKEERAQFAMSAPPSVPMSADPEATIRSLTIDTDPPPLPPRAADVVSRAPFSGPLDSEARQSMPPRYSTVFGPPVANSPSSYLGPVDGFGPPRRGDWSLHGSDMEENPTPVNNESTDSLFGQTTPTVRRKPVGSSEASKVNN